MRDNDKGFRSGFAVLAGAPNAGKSTLMNRLAGGSLAIVSPKPQTTRENLLAVCDGDDYQLVLLDTPGFLTPKYKLQELMLAQIHRAVRDDADIICFVAEPCQPGEKEKALAQMVATLNVPIIVAVNKIDSIPASAAQNILEEYKKLLCPKSAHLISAKRGDGVKELRAALKTRCRRATRISPPDSGPTGGSAISPPNSCASSCSRSMRRKSRTPAPP